MAKDGRLLDISLTISPMRDAQGRIVGASKVARDVTERRRAEEALRASEERFRTLTAHAPVGIFLTDREGNCLFVNERWCDMAGLTPEEAQGQGWVRALHPEDKERVFREWSAAVEAGTPFASEYRFRTPAGKETWLDGNASGLRDESGQVSEYIGTLTDITERREAVEALREADRRKDEFLALLAHELRNPLAPLRNGLAGDAAGDQRRARRRQGAGHDGPAALPHGAADRRPARHLPHQPQQDGAAPLPGAPRGCGQQRGGDRPSGARGGRARADGLPAAGAGPPGRRPDPAGPGVRQPAQQQRQVHRTGRARLAHRHAAKAARSP